VRKGHAVQYIALPGHDVFALRKAAPEKYENPADIFPVTWHRLRIEVTGARARVMVDGDEALVVDEKFNGADSRSGVALWVGPGTYGFFRNLTVNRRAKRDQIAV